MDGNLVYTKTPTGEEATRQRTRVVQRNLRMVLLQVDGQLSVSGLIEKIGNEALVHGALRELEKGGYIALAGDAPSVWTQSRFRAKKVPAPAPATPSSGFGVSKSEVSGYSELPSITSQFSSFGKPIQPVEEPPPLPPQSPQVVAPQPPQPSRAAGPGVMQRLAAWRAKRAEREAPDLKPYRHVSWGKRITLGIVVVVLAATAGLFLFPFNTYRSGIESAIAKAVGVPVRIGAIEARLSPTPAFVFRNVRVGANDEAVIGSVAISKFWTLLGSGAKAVGEVRISEVALQGDFFATLSKAVVGLRSSSDFSTDRISLKSARLVLGDVAITGLSGSFNPGNDKEPFVLETDDHSLRMLFAPAAGGASVVVEGGGWKPSEESPYRLSMIAMKGIVQSGKAVFDSAEIGIADGRAHGKWNIDWSKGLSLSVDATTSAISVRKMTKALSVPAELDGWLSGPIHLRASGTDWGSMWRNAEAHGRLQLEHTTWMGADLGEATRRGGGQPIRGGSTKFERVRGNFSLSGGQVRVSEIDAEAGLVRTSGQFMAKPDGSFDGLFQITIQSSVMPVRSAVKVFGTLPTLESVAAR